MTAPVLRVMVIMLYQDKILILYLVKVKSKIIHIYEHKTDDNNPCIVYN